MGDDHVKRRVVSCGACIYRITVDRRAEVLLVMSFRNTGSWGLPKGHVDPEEEMLDTAHREVYEETGLEIGRTEDKLPVVSTKDPYEIKDVHTWLATHHGPARPTPHDPDGEIKAVEWHDIESLPKIKKYQRPAVRAAVTIVRARLDNHVDGVEKFRRNIHRIFGPLFRDITRE